MNISPKDITVEQLLAVLEQLNANSDDPNKYALAESLSPLQAAPLREEVKKVLYTVYDLQPPCEDAEGFCMCQVRSVFKVGLLAGILLGEAIGQKQELERLTGL